MGSSSQREGIASTSTGGSGGRFDLILILACLSASAPVGLLREGEEGSASVRTAGQVVQVLNALRQSNDAGARPQPLRQLRRRLAAGLVAVEHDEHPPGALEEGQPPRAHLSPQKGADG